MERCKDSRSILENTYYKANSTDSNMAPQVKDENGNTIHKGDTVVTKVRGGKHEGKVSITTF